MKISRRGILQSGFGVGMGQLFLGSSLVKAQEVAGKRPRGVVFMVSDGMSQGVLAMADTFALQLTGKGSVWGSLMRTPQVAAGLMETASSDALVTDSAAAASAWSTGKRIPNGQICVDENGKNLESIGETLVKAGAKVGLVSTATITHATPAGFATNAVSRGNEKAIAPQYLNRVDVLLGGGSPFFDKAGRGDGRDLFGEYEKAGYGVVKSRDEMLRSKSEKLLGIFSAGHLPYMIDWKESAEMQKKVPTLAEMTEVALSRFLAGPSPFLLQVEGARIDHAAHNNDIGAILREQLAFDDSLAKVLEMLGDRDDILVVVTSDHGNANPGLNGSGAGYRQTGKQFERIAGVKASHDVFLGKWRREKAGGVAKFQELAKGDFGIEVTKEEAEAVIDSVAGKPVVEWHDALDNPVGLLGQIIGNHTATGWSGVTHTSDWTQINALGPGCFDFQGLVRNDQVREILLKQLLG